MVLISDRGISFSFDSNESNEGEINGGRCVSGENERKDGKRRVHKNWLFTTTTLTALLKNCAEQP